MLQRFSFPVFRKMRIRTNDSHQFWRCTFNLLFASDRSSALCGLFQFDWIGMHIMFMRVFFCSVLLTLSSVYNAVMCRVCVVILRSSCKFFSLLWFLFYISMFRFWAVQFLKEKKYEKTGSDSIWGRSRGRGGSAWVKTVTLICNFDNMQIIYILDMGPIVLKWHVRFTRVPFKPLF